MSETLLQTKTNKLGANAAEVPEFADIPFDRDFGEPVEWRLGERVRIYKAPLSPLRAALRANLPAAIFAIAAICAWLIGTSADSLMLVVIAFFLALAAVIGLLMRSLRIPSLIKGRETLIDWHAQQVRLRTGRKEQVIRFPEIACLQVLCNDNVGNSSLNALRSRGSWMLRLYLCPEGSRKCILRASASGYRGAAAEHFEQLGQALAQAIGVKYEIKDNFIRRKITETAT